MEYVAAVAGLVFVVALLIAYWFGVRAVGFAAERKGHSYATWSLIALVALLPAAIIVMCLEDRSEDAHDPELRPCPECAELIQPQARLCRFCHSQVAPV